MTNLSRNQYRLLAIERVSRGSARALIAGPGALGGVWYPVANAREAARVVEDLNLTRLYGAQLARSRGGRQAKRSVSGR